MFSESFKNTYLCYSVEIILAISRITSNKKHSFIPIEGFHLAYNELIRKGRVTRDYINQEVDKRCSSGIVLILGQIPFVSIVRNPTSLEIQRL